jgi:hypothetical protein
LAAVIPWFWALGHSLVVASVQDCPAPALVDAQVREILGLAAEDPLEERATLAREGNGLRVIVRGKDERVIGERLLQAEGTCDELAGAVAVVMAAWISDVHPEYVGTLPENPAPSVTPPLLLTDAVKPAPAPRAERSHHGLLGVALGADLSGATAAPLAALSWRLMARRFGVGLGATATFIAPRTAQLSPGSVRYFRWPLLLGPTLRLPFAVPVLELQAGAALAWLRLEGVDFSPPQAHDDFAGGGFLSLRAAMGAGSFVPFAELSGVAWRSTEAFVRHGSERPSVSLPGFELYGALGATWRAW